MSVYRCADFEVQMKSDHTPLTLADRLADEVINDGLGEMFPDVAVLSEESWFESDSLIPTETFFLVDPLDGTKEFIERNGEFTVNIALIHRGKSVAGVIYAPALDEMFFAAHGLGAWKTDSLHTDELPLRAVLTSDILTHSSEEHTEQARALRIVGSRSHGAGTLDDWLAQLGRPFEFVSMGSSLKFCRVAEGVADVYPRFAPTCQWDTAAGQCIVEVAGGEVLICEGGESLPYGLTRGMVNPSFICRGAGHSVHNTPVSCSR